MKIMNQNKLTEMLAWFTVPRILVLVSKYPIYSEMRNFLTKIKDWAFRETRKWVEHMLINLIYEFPFPGDQYQVKSNFWRMDLKNEKQK